MPILHREACSMETDQCLRHCFLSVPPRQGRLLWLPTLPFQQTNRYAVDSARPPTSTWVIMNSLLSRSGVKNELERHRYQAPLDRLTEERSLF